MSLKEPPMIEALWHRYARIWSLDTSRRDAEMAACLAPDVTYADPQISLSGVRPFAEYMAGFGNSFPGHAFRINAVKAHHDRSAARWDLVNAAGGTVFPGISFGVVGGDGRFLSLSGFFGGI